jgi:hypothetical protein
MLFSVADSFSSVLRTPAVLTSVVPDVPVAARARRLSIATESRASGPILQMPVPGS